MLNEHIIKLIGGVIFLCLLGASAAMAGTAQYTYDNLDRLVQVQFDDGTTIQYTYDAVGNRLVKQVTAFHASAPETAPDSGWLATAPLPRKFSFTDWWWTLWGSQGESAVTMHLTQ